MFYKKGGYTPEKELISYGANFFVLKIALSEKEFEDIKQILFAEFHNPDTSEKSDLLCMSYYIGYLEGSNWLFTNFLNNREDFLRTSVDVTKFFKGTKYETQVKTRWKMIFDRIGIKPD